MNFTMESIQMASNVTCPVCSTKNFYKTIKRDDGKKELICAQCRSHIKFVDENGKDSNLSVLVE